MDGVVGNVKVLDTESSRFVFHFCLSSGLWEEEFIVPNYEFGVNWNSTDSDNHCISCGLRIIFTVKYVITVFK